MFVWIIIGIVIVSIAVLVLFGGKKQRVRLERKADVLEMWRTACPDHAATDAMLEPSAFAALIDLEDGGTGLLWANGKKPMGRVLKGGTLKEDGARLHISLPDYHRPVIFEIEAPLVRRIWKETLKTELSEAG